VFVGGASNKEKRKGERKRSSKGGVGREATTSSTAFVRRRDLNLFTGRGCCRYFLKGGGIREGGGEIDTSIRVRGGRLCIALLSLIEGGNIRGVVKGGIVSLV